MKKCEVNECDNRAYQGEKKCILHCDKGNYLNSDAKFYKQFLQELGLHIANTLFKKFQNSKLDYIKNKEFIKESVNVEGLKTILFSDVIALDLKSNAWVLSHEKTELADISFPDNFDDKRIFKYLVSITFEKCEFWNSELSLMKPMYYENCEFRANLNINNINIYLWDSFNLFKDCRFRGMVNLLDVVNPNHTDSKKRSLFSDCEFIDQLNIKNSYCKFQIFNNSNNFKTKFRCLTILKCEFEEEFILNNNDIEIFKVDNSTFKSVFEFKRNEITNNFEIVSTNFEGLVDTFKSKFSKFFIKKSTFNVLASFEDCEFGIFSDKSNEHIAILRYTSFLSFVNFRNTCFHSGLDIESTNLKETPNFYGTKIEHEKNKRHNTNQETFRLIKYSFDKVENYIEANKYFALEMIKRGEFIKDHGTFSEKIVFWFNKTVSNFGQDYTKPVFWLCISSIIYCYIGHLYENNILYTIYEPINEFLKKISYQANELATYILPIGKSILKPGMEFISLIFYFINSTLIWQFIVALKRHTRR